MAQMHGRNCYSGSRESAQRPVRPQDAKINAPVEPIAPALEKVVSGSLRRAPAADAPLLAWPLACGSAVAARTRALGFREGILQVEVPDAGWRTELQRLAPQYLAILNRYASGVTRIEFVLRRAS